MLLRIALCVISLSLGACAGWFLKNDLPEFPEVLQCGYSVKHNKFRCKNTKTGEAFDLRRDDPVMEGAQCLPTKDRLQSYGSSEAWVASIKSIATQRCK